jgi:sulfate transport system ATP-binding protein
VLGFVGPTTRVGGEWARPHDLELLHDPVEGATEAIIERVVHLGFEVRVELVAGDGERLWAQVTRDACEELELAGGQIVYVRATRSASEVSSSTPRMLARRSIQTSRSPVAGPV